MLFRTISYKRIFRRGYPSARWLNAPPWSYDKEGSRGWHDWMDEHQNPRVLSCSGRRSVIHYIYCELCCLGVSMCCPKPELALCQIEFYNVCPPSYCPREAHTWWSSPTKWAQQSTVGHGVSEASVREEQISSYGHRVDLLACRALALSSRSKAQE